MLERPAFFPDNQHGLVLAVRNDLMLGLEGGEETPAHGRIVNRVAGQHDLLAAWTQHRIICCGASVRTASASAATASSGLR